MAKLWIYEVIFIIHNVWELGNNYSTINHSVILCNAGLFEIECLEGFMNFDPDFVQ